MGLFVINPTKQLKYQLSSMDQIANMIFDCQDLYLLKFAIKIKIDD